MSDHTKINIYQVFTRLFGNCKTYNKPWGTIEENGVGKFSSFTDKALQEIKNLGITHIWYTGVLHHALIGDYTSIGVSHDDPDVVKGRAGSPYAIKDYYTVDPDLADVPSQRLEEFKSLIDRTHRHGLKLIIDIVPNHVARKYEGKCNPQGVSDFGSKDDTSLEYSKHNNFYYIPGERFKTPHFTDDFRPLGAELNPLSDGEFDEFPAKWTGNGSRKAQPDFQDWYETVKINFGIRPDGTKDFPELPESFYTKDPHEHDSFWANIEVPDSWSKFRDIANYWMDFGVDGFRYDMAEMVPVEFWSYLNSSIKIRKNDTLLLAEVYNPMRYREYIRLGKMDYLYDKVDLYDTLKCIIQGQGTTDQIVLIQNKNADIEHHMSHFMENHDEQRIANPEFAGNTAKGKPAMVVSATIGTSPTMIYFGQEVGEPALEDAGFGKPSRTSIFDYIGVPHHQRWMNEGKFDGGRLSEPEKQLRDFYTKLLQLALQSTALMGEYREIHFHNRHHTHWYNNQVFSFVRWDSNQKLVIISNFNAHHKYGFDLEIPQYILNIWALGDGVYGLSEKLYGNIKPILNINQGIGKIRVELNPLESWILEIH